MICKIILNKGTFVQQLKITRVNLFIILRNITPLNPYKITRPLFFIPLFLYR